MRLRKREFPPRKTEWRQSRDPGQVEWAAGMFFTLLLAILMYTQLQLASWQATSDWMEDALAASNLAAALIDIEEYGISHKVQIPDAEAAYQVYRSAVWDNLSLDENRMSTNRALISGPVEIADFVVYNVVSGKVHATRVNEAGSIAREWDGTLGEETAPNGVLIEHTGIYSEIRFEVASFPGITAQAHKGKLVDIVSELPEQEPQFSTTGSADKQTLADEQPESVSRQE